MPTNNNQRRHTRLACEVPSLLVTEAGEYGASVIDASRSGVRLRVKGQTLGVYRLAPLAFISRQVSRLLGPEFEVRLHPDRLGNLLSKRLRPVRIGQRDAASADVELGCVLAKPFSDEEAAMLGLGLPMVRADGVEADERLKADKPTPRTEPSAPPTPPASAPIPAPATRSVAPTAVRVAPPQAPRPPAPGRSLDGPPSMRPAPASPVAPVSLAPVEPAAKAPPPPVPAGPAVAPAHGWRAYVHPMEQRTTVPFVARTESISTRGVQLRVGTRDALGLQGSVDVAGTMEALGTTYGSDVALRLVDGTAHLWTGPARIEMIEVGTEAPHPVTLWLAFGRALRPAELRALTLA